MEESTGEWAVAMRNWDVRLRTEEDLDSYLSRDFGKEVEVSGAVGFVLHFRRVYTYHLMQTFLPSILISLSSVVSVFISPSLVPGRMGLCITAFLSMISLFNGGRSGWPVTARLKAIDYWCGGCYLTVFAALIEYCLVLYLTREQREEERRRGDKRSGGCKTFRLALAARVESWSKVVLPVGFLLFNVAFWATVGRSPGEGGAGDGI